MVGVRAVDTNSVERVQSIVDGTSAFACSLVQSRVSRADSAGVVAVIEGMGAGAIAL